MEIDLTQPGSAFRLAVARSNMCHTNIREMSWYHWHQFYCIYFGQQYTDPAQMLSIPVNEYKCKEEGKDHNQVPHLTQGTTWESDKTEAFSLLTVPRWCFFCGSFLLFMLCVCHSFLSFHCSLEVTCWERADLLTCLYLKFSCVLLLSHVVS